MREYQKYRAKSSNSESGRNRGRCSATCLSDEEEQRIQRLNRDSRTGARIRAQVPDMGVRGDDELENRANSSRSFTGNCSHVLWEMSWTNFIFSTSSCRLKFSRCQRDMIVIGRAMPVLSVDVFEKKCLALPTN